MSLLDRKVRSLLAKALQHNKEDEEDKSVPESLIEAFNVLKDSLTANIIPSIEKNEIMGLDLIVLISEVAITLKHFNFAKESTTIFFLQDPPLDQFYCRALFCQARVLANHSRSQNGFERIKTTKAAVQKVLEAVQIATTKANRPRYDFLVYNASIHMWQIVRPCLRKSSSSAFVDDMEKILAGLQEVNDSNIEWRVKWLIVLAFSYDDGGNAAKAIAHITNAGLLVKNLDSGGGANSLKSIVSRLEIHVSRATKTIANLKGFDYKIKDNITIMLQYCKSGCIKGIEAKEEIKKALQCLSPSLHAKYLDLPQPPENNEFKEDIEMLLLFARVSSFLGFSDLSKLIADSISNIKDIFPVLSVEISYLKCELMATSNKFDESLNNSSSKLNSAAAKLDSRRIEALGYGRRIEALKIMERTLSTCKRLDKPHLLEEGAIISWNIALPLLQPQLRKHAHRTLQIAASLLEDIESLNTDLRSRLHYEIAKCEISSDFLSKAKIQAVKSIEQDYGKTISKDDIKKTSTEVLSEIEINELLRPLDRYLSPMLNKLNLQTALYSEPETPEEQAMLLIEQSKDAKDVHLKETLLKRAVGILEPVTFLKDSPQIITDINKAVTLRVTLWGEIMRAAWKQKIVATTQKSCAAVLLNKWNIDRFRDFVLMQAEAYIILSETYIEDLKLMPLTFVTLQGDLKIDCRALGIVFPEIPQQVMQIKERIIESIVESMKLGVLLKDSIVTENACLCLWNFHLHIFKDNRYSCVLPSLTVALGECKKSLEIINSIDMKLRCSINFVLSRLYEQAKDFDKAIDIATATSKLAKPIYCKDNLLVLARSLISKGKLPKDALAAVDNNISKVIVGLEVMTLQTITKELKKEILGIISDLMKAADVEFIKVIESKDELLEICNAYLELNAELWSKLSAQALEMGDFSKAQFFARFCINKLPLDNSNTPYNILRWYSLSECLWGQAIAAMINSQTQSKEVQDDVRMKAIEHFTNAAKLGAKSKTSNVVLDAAKRFWNISIPLMDINVSRKKLFSPLLVMIKELATVGSNSDLPFRVSLYRLLLECYYDNEDWRGGLNASDEAFQHIPSSEQKPLWEFRMLFLSKLGHDVAVAISKMKVSDETLMAKVWMTLASNSLDRKDQLSAYLSAITLLQSSWARVYVIAELADWMQANYFPKQSILDQIYSAIDILLDFEAPLGDIDEDDEMNTHDEDGSVAKSKGSKSSSKSPSIALSKVSKGSGVPKSIAKSHQNSLARGGKRSVGVKSGRSGANSSVGTKIKASVASTAKTGGDNTASQTPTALNISHMEMLFQLYLKIAILASNFDERREALVIAQFYVCKMWERTCITFNEYQSEINKSGLPTSSGMPDSNSTASGSSSTLPKVGDALLSLPKSSSEWLEAEVSENLIKFGKSCPSELHANLLFHPQSIKAPPLCLHYLTILHDLLHEHGLSEYACPILFVSQVVAKSLPTPIQKEYTSLLSVRGYNLAESLNLKAISNKFFSQTGNLTLSNTIKNLFTEEVELREQQDTTSVNVSEQKNIKDGNKKRVNDGKGNEVKPRGLKERGEGEISLSVLPPTISRKKLTSIVVREVWFQLAKAAVRLGNFGGAKSYLIEAQRHNRAFKDTINAAKCFILEAWIEFYEGNSENAIQKLLDQQKLFDKSDFKIWSECCESLIIFYTSVEDVTSAKYVCNLMLETLTALSNKRLNSNNNPSSPTPESKSKENNNEDVLSDLDISIAFSSFQSRLATIITDEALNYKSRGGNWTELWDQAKKLFESALARYNHLNGNISSIKVALDYINSIEKFNSDDLLTIIPADLHEINISLLENAVKFLERLLAQNKPENLMTLVVLPEERLLAAIKQKLGGIILRRSKVTMDEFAVVKDISFITDCNSKTVVDEWLIDTAPSTEISPENLLQKPSARCLLYFSSVASVYGQVPHLFATSLANLGSCQSRIAIGGKKETFWPIKDSKMKSSPSTPDISKVDKNTNQLLNVAIETLKKSIDIGISTKDWASVGIAAESLVECYGSLNSLLSVRYLSIYQSCKYREKAIKLFQDASVKNSREALCMKLLEKMKQDYLNPFSNPIYEKIESYLETSSLAWQRVTPNLVSIPFEEAITSIAPNTLVVMLQFSSCGQYFYLSTIRGKNASEIAQETASIDPSTGLTVSPVSSNIFKYSLTSAVRQELVSLRQKCSSWMEGTGKVLVRYEADAGDGGDFVDMSQADNAEVEFQSIAKQLNETLLPFFEGVKDLLREWIKLKNPIVLIADNLLNELPLESLEIFDGAFISREFTLSMLVTKSKATNSSVTASNKMSYIVDPQNEDVNKSDGKVTMQGVMQPIIKGWVGGGVMGAERIPSIGEIQKLFTNREGGGIVFFCPGRLLTHIPTGSLTGLNMKSCNLAIIIDRCDNDISSRRQSKIDTKKSIKELKLETSLSTAMLLSLNGVQTVACNQWQNSIFSNKKIISELLPTTKGISETLNKVLHSDNDRKIKLKGRVRYNTIVWGLPLNKIQ